MILAGDIGGTNTRLRLCNLDSSPTEPIADRRYHSQQFRDLRDIIADFLKVTGAKPTTAAIGVAGPVFGGRSQPTNIAWSIDADELVEAFSFDQIDVKNDLVTTGYGIEWLSPSQFASIQDGVRQPDGNGALIAAGTGLGKAILVRKGDDFHPIPSEGGHADFAPRDPQQDRLVRYLRERDGRASAEHVVSGPGLWNVYRFILADSEQTEVAEVAARLAGDGRSRVVSEAAREGASALCREAMTLFMSAYGNEASNLAITTLATGGLFIGGGIAPKLLDFLQDGSFLYAFLDNSDLRHVLTQIPVKVILEEDASLIGATAHALAMAR